MVLGINGHSIDRTYIFVTAMVENPYAAQICEQTFIKEIKSKHLHLQIHFESCGAFFGFCLLGLGFGQPKNWHKA